MSAPRKSPTGWLYVLAFLLPIGGCVATGSMVYSGLGGLEDKLEALPRAAVGEGSAVQLAAGDCEIFYETRGNADKVSFQRSTTASDAPVPVRCTLLDPAGARVALEAPSGHTSYAASGRAARSIFHADLPRAGSYQISCAYAGDASGSADGTDRLVFVSASIFVGIAKLFLPAIAGVLAGFGLAIVTFVLRRRSVS